jgi:hypothetical protein
MSKVIEIILNTSLIVLAINFTLVVLYLTGGLEWLACLLKSTC